mmetsp:Transcript_25300/g.60927  ORF Transcript_25300/g.60927 Transcript_25300/m.60927 type:complete len:246 (+) Transcript_25300:7275-8012(+)
MLPRFVRVEHIEQPALVVDEPNPSQLQPLYNGRAGPALEADGRLSEVSEELEVADPEASTHRKRNKPPRQGLDDTRPSLGTLHRCLLLCKVNDRDVLCGVCPLDLTLSPQCRPQFGFEIVHCQNGVKAAIVEHRKESHCLPLSRWAVSPPRKPVTGVQSKYHPTTTHATPHNGSRPHLNQHCRVQVLSVRGEQIIKGRRGPYVLSLTAGVCCIVFCSGSALAHKLRFCWLGQAIWLLALQALEQV